jgi:septum formation protein
MNSHNILFLGSKSPSRKELLEQAGINFIGVSQDADETQCDWRLPLEQVVNHIALYKMKHVILPDGDKENEVCFVLTADTLSLEPDGTISGKPTDREDAIAKIKAAQKGWMRTATAFCLDRKIWKNGVWHLEERIQDCVVSEYIFHIPDNWIERYLEHEQRSAQASGAIAIEQFGIFFFKEVRGSFSSIVGLPMYELREALEKIGFFK